ncbi:MAG: flagellar assembly protein FliW [Calditrichia bacterium]
MKVNTLQFGEIEVDEDKILNFPNGIIGFEDCRKFVLITNDDLEPFQWLSCIDKGKEDIGFPLLMPFILLPDYFDELPKVVKEDIQKDQNSDLNILNVVTIKPDDGKMTINLRAPIIIDAGKKEGKQLILPKESIPVDFALEPAEEVE